MWDEPDDDCFDDDCFVALRACHLPHRRQFIATAPVATRFRERDQPAELADWFIADREQLSLMAECAPARTRTTG